MINGFPLPLYAQLTTRKFSDVTGAGYTHRQWMSDVGEALNVHEDTLNTGVVLLSDDTDLAAAFGAKRFTFESNTTPPTLAGLRARNGPAAVTSGTVLFQIGGGGYVEDTTDDFVNSRALATFVAAEDWLSAAQGARIELKTTKTGTVTPAVRWTLDDKGDVTHAAGAVSGQALVGGAIRQVNAIQFIAPHVMGATPNDVSVASPLYVNVDGMTYAGASAFRPTTTYAFYARGLAQIEGIVTQETPTITGKRPPQLCFQVIHRPKAEPTAKTGTVTGSTDTVNITAHGYAANDRVRVYPTAPTGLSTGVNYWVIASGLTANAFKLSLTQGGAAVDITASDGTAITVRRVFPLTYANDPGRVYLGGAANSHYSDVAYNSDPSRAPDAQWNIGLSDQYISGNTGDSNDDSKITNIWYASFYAHPYFVQGAEAERIVDIFAADPADLFTISGSTPAIGKARHISLIECGRLAGFWAATATAATDRITYTNHSLVNGTRVYMLDQVPTGGSANVPPGLAIDTLYYVVNATVNDFQLSLTVGGAAVNITADTTNVGFRAPDLLIAPQGASEAHIGFRNAGTTVWHPTTFTATAGSSIPVLSTQVDVTIAADVTLGTPSIATATGIGNTNPQHGQVVTITNVSPSLLTFVDGTGVDLIGSTLVLAQWESATFRYSVIEGKWKHQGSQYFGALVSDTLKVGPTATDPSGIARISSVGVGIPILQLSSVVSNDDPTETAVQAKAQTTNATQATLTGASVTVPTDSVVVVEAVVTAARTDARGDVAGYKLIGTFKNIGGTYSQVGSTSVVHAGESQAAWDCVFDTNAGAGPIRIRITGEAAKTIVWHATVRYWTHSA